MLDAARSPLRSLSPMQLVVTGVVGLILLFLVIGTVTQSSAPEPLFGGIQSQPFPILAGLAFVAGLLSFASPCTLPILPAYFAFAFQSGRKQIALNTATFMLGLAATFSIMGAGASAIGQVMRQNQQLIMLVGGALIVVFGVMSLLGKGFTGVKADEEQVRRNTMGGSFLFGMTFAVGWSSCIGPILGTVLAMATTAGSVYRGVMLLFIYAMGLGLPLVVVSTFFGRASRKSLFWRVLRGKGWLVETHVAVVGVVWVLAIWRILVAVVDYAFLNFETFDGQVFTSGHEIGLLVVAIIGVALWIFTGPNQANRRMQIQLHTTQLVSGALFIMMGLLMMNGTLATFNRYLPPDLAIWFADIEDRLITIFS